MYKYLKNNLDQLIKLIKNSFKKPFFFINKIYCKSFFMKIINWNKRSKIKKKITFIKKETQQ